MDALGFQRLKVVALAVTDITRARRFYRETLALPPPFEGSRQVGYALGNVIVMLKAVAEGGFAQPTDQLNPRLTLATDHAPDAQRALLARSVTVSTRCRPITTKASMSAAFSIAKATGYGSARQSRAGMQRPYRTRTRIPDSGIC